MTHIWALLMPIGAAIAMVQSRWVFQIFENQATQR